MRRSGQIKTLFLALLILFSLSYSVYAQSSAAKGSGSANKPSLASARTALSKLAASDALPAQLEAQALALPVHDAVTLFKEFLPKIKAPSRGSLASLAGSMALLAGRYEDAGFLFLQGVEAEPKLGHDAVRSYLAAGNFQEARKVLDKLQAQAPSSELEKKNRIALAWLYLLDNKKEMAFILLRDFVSGGTGSMIQSDPAMREALFLLWILASSSDFSGFSVSTTGFETSSIARRLELEYPGSAEHTIVQRGLSLTPSAWVLTGLFPYPEARQSALAGEPSSDPEAVDERSPGGGKDSGTTDKEVRLQVGWFSRRENASALSSTLKNKGFSVSMEEQKAQDGQTRWAVIVDAQGDWSKTQARLKDSGYESYLLP